MGPKVFHKCPPRFKSTILLFVAFHLILVYSVGLYILVLSKFPPGKIFNGKTQKLLLPKGGINFSLSSEKFGTISENERRKILEKKNYSFIQSAGKFGALSETERMKNLENYCKNHPEDAIKSTTLNSIFVIDKYKLLFCYMPKVGTNSWRTTFLKLYPNGKMAKNLYDRRVFVTLARFSPEEIQKRLNTYHKVMFVRNPMSRMLSAYREKFGFTKLNKLFRRNYGRKILRKYRKNVQPDLPLKDVNVTFTEFVQFLVDYRSLERMNRHWRPMFTICQPCAVNYTFVGSLEHSAEDSLHVLKTINAPTNLSLARESPNKGHETYSDDQIAKQHWFRQVPSNTVKKAISKYRADFEAFGYKLPVFGPQGYQEV